MSETQVFPQEGRPLTAEEILKNARDLKLWIRERADDIEAARQLPRDVVDRLLEAGVFRMMMPKSWGGPEMTSMQQNEVIEELSRADGSVGWCVMIGCDTGFFSGYLDDNVARQMYPKLDMIQAAWLEPVGQAHRVTGGYRVSGHWRFGSGCTHSDWLSAACRVYENGKLVIGPNDQPIWRVMTARPDEYEILDTWYTTGLRGSGSNDYLCCNLFVPDERTFSFSEPAKREGLLWRRPDTLLRKMPGVPLGIARDAIDAVRDICAKKCDHVTNVRYSDIPRVQLAISKAEMLLGAARAYVYNSLERYWERLEADSDPTPEERAACWLARANAFQSARKVIQLMYDTLGSSAIYFQKSPLDRHLRDIYTICQHSIAQEKRLEPLGMLLLGTEPPGEGFL